MNKKIPHIVQYQGSKRIIAPKILMFMPEKFNRLIEPFSGMASISVSVAAEERTMSFVINDLNKPLSDVLKMVVDEPNELINRYNKLWHEQMNYPSGHIDHYYHVREMFNLEGQTPERMLYLLARCVKGAVRYGKNGYFNQSLDKRRHGTNPINMEKNILGVSKLLNGKVVVSSLDYKEILKTAIPGDVVYMDPPYQGVCSSKDSRYFSGIDFDEFVIALEDLNRRKIDFLVSYDGSTGNKKFGKDLPVKLNLKKVMINAGLSSQATLLGKVSVTLEALYISEGLYKKISYNNPELIDLEVV